MTGWEILICAVIGIFVVGFVCVVFLARDLKARRVRLGVFMERELHDEPEE